LGYVLLLLLQWVSQYQKGKTSLDYNDARDDGVWGWQWHQLDYRQRICTTHPTDNHTDTPPLNFYRPTNSVKALKADC